MGSEQARPRVVPKEEQGKELASRLLTAGESAATGRIMLGELLARHEAEVSQHERGCRPREDARRIDLWTQVLGANSDPETGRSPVSSG